jgi:hypothetical protein
MKLFPSKTAQNTATACYLAHKPLLKWIGNDGFQKREDGKYTLTVERKKPDLWYWNVTGPMGDTYEGYRPSMATAKNRAVQAMNKDKETYGKS